VVTTILVSSASEIAGITRIRYVHDLKLVQGANYLKFDITGLKTLSPTAKGDSDTEQKHCVKS